MKRYDWIYDVFKVLSRDVFSAKLVPLAYGIKKLQISCVVEDDKVSVEDLEEKICAFEDYVSQSQMLMLAFCCCRH